jgi:hypothetical protein
MQALTLVPVMRSNNVPSDVTFTAPVSLQLHEVVPRNITPRDTCSVSVKQRLDTAPKWITVCKWARRQTTWLCSNCACALRHPRVLSYHSEHVRSQQCWYCLLWCDSECGVIECHRRFGGTSYLKFQDRRYVKIDKGPVFMKITVFCDATQCYGLLPTFRWNMLPQCSK